MPGIILVDDDASFLETLADILRERGYEIATASGGQEAIEKVKSTFFDLMITDIRMPGLDGIETLAGAREKHSDLRGIVITGYESAEDPIRAIKNGVDDYFVKPFDEEEFLASVDRSLKELKAAHDYKEERKKIRDDFISTVKQIALAIEGRDPYYSGHSQNVASFATKMGNELGLPRATIESLEIASYLHDLGQVEIQQAIIQKRGVLSGMEYEEIKKHPAFARNLLQAIPRFQSVIDIIFYHHEKFDGTGYPVGLKGNEIPLDSRILSLAEAYSSLLEMRPHRDAFSPEEALTILRQESGTSFDPSLIETLIKCISRDAEESMEEIGERREEEPTRERKRRFLIRVAHILLEMGQLQEARRAFEECLRLDEESKDSLFIMALRGLAFEALASGEVEKAKKLASRAEKCARGSNSYDQALIHIAKSAISIRKGASAKARAMLGDAEEIFSKWGAHGELVRTCLYRARALIGEPGSPPPRREFQDALAMALNLVRTYSLESILMEEMELTIPLLCTAFFQAIKIDGVRDYLFMLGKRNPRALTIELQKATEKHVLLFLHYMEGESLDEFKEMLTSLRESACESVRSRAAHLSTKITGAETAPVTCRACCMGRFTFFAGTSLIDDQQWKTAKSRYILAYLLINGQERIAEDKIFDAFWRDAPPQKARRRLNSAISQVRHVLESALHRTPLEIIMHEKESYFLNPQLRLSIDVRDFASFYERGLSEIKEDKIEEGIGSLQRAESLYGGDLLEGFAMEWVEEKRMSQRLIYGEILLLLIRHHYENECHDVCLHYARKLLSLDERHEKAHFYLIKSLLAVGNKKEAMAAYDTCVEVLRKELGMAPPPEIEELMLAIR
jgi:putative two-component system response regulator